MRIFLSCIGWLVCFGCAGPSMMGFPHSNMHPEGENEFAIVPHFGGGATMDTGGGFVTGGGVLSYVHDFGAVAMSVAGGAYIMTEEPNIHGHIEVGRKIANTGNDILFGVGYADNLSMGIPQLSVGVQHAAPLTSHGLFAGVRSSAGPIFDRELSGALVAISAAVGYQWRGRRVFGFSIQGAPYLCYFAMTDGSLAGGAIGMLSFSFGHREKYP